MSKAPPKVKGPEITMGMTFHKFDNRTDPAFHYSAQRKKSPMYVECTSVKTLPPDQLYCMNRPSGHVGYPPDQKLYHREFGGEKIPIGSHGSPLQRPVNPKLRQSNDVPQEAKNRPNIKW